jgi:DNA-binding GntR family transcriptional regulator
MSVVPAAKLVRELAEKIQGKIGSGEYPPGTRLRQEELADAFGVSRTPIREALSQLEAKGVISQTPRRSAIVRAPSSRDVRETYQVRAEVEGLAAQLATEWISDRQLDELRQVHRRFVRAVNLLQRLDARSNGATNRAAAKAVDAASAEWIETNALFHSIIHKACNNACLRRVIEDLHLGHTRNIMMSSALGMNRRRMERTISHHEAILEGLESRDPAKARRAMAQHILESGEFVVAWFENQTPAAAD